MALILGDDSRNRGARRRSESWLSGWRSPGWLRDAARDRTLEHGGPGCPLDLFGSRLQGCEDLTAERVAETLATCCRESSTHRRTAR